MHTVDLLILGAVLFFWPVWWLCWAIVRSAANALLGIEE